MSHRVHYSPVLGGLLLSPGISQPAETCQLLIDSYPPKKAEPCQCKRIFASRNNFISGVVLDSNGAGFSRLYTILKIGFPGSSQFVNPNMQGWIDVATKQVSLHDHLFRPDAPEGTFHISGR